MRAMVSCPNVATFVVTDPPRFETSFDRDRILVISTPTAVHLPRSANVSSASVSSDTGNGSREITPVPNGCANVIASKGKVDNDPMTSHAFSCLADVFDHHVLRDNELLQRRLQSVAASNRKRVVEAK